MTTPKHRALSFESHHPIAHKKAVVKSLTDHADNIPITSESRSRKLRFPNTVFAGAIADATQHVHKDCKNKYAVDTAIILFTQSPLYLCYFSS